MGAPEDDTALWRAALAGDGRAFGALFDRHYDRVFRHVVGLVEQPADADEVTASAFLELWRRRSAVRVVAGSVLPWLLVTAGNLARNEYRRRRRYRRLLAELVPHGAAGGATTDDVDDRHDLARALRRLRPADAQVVLLAAELPMAQVAAVLGVPPGTARVRLHRARERLRREAAGGLPQPSLEEER